MLHTGFRGLMKNHSVRLFALSATLVSGILAQNQGNQRQASIVGGGGPDRGKCTIEVVVDAVAQVEVRGSTAVLKTLSGQPAQWRRFECSSPMPPNPVNFRFAGVDGRGRQDLMRAPGNGSPAVIQIEDKDSGSEGYTFDLTWGGGFNPGPTGPPPQQQQQQQQQYPDRADRGGPPAYGPPAGYDRDRYDDRDYRPNYRDSDYFRRYGHGFTVDQAVRICQDSVMTQAHQRFRGNPDMHFGRTRIDDQPGRQDWVTGTLDVYRGNHEERFGFSCSVNFDSGRVRSADLDMRPLPEERH